MDKIIVRSDVDEMSLMSLKKNNESPTSDVNVIYTDEGTNVKRPKYYEGIFVQDHTMSSASRGPVTPVSLRTPINNGVLNLPRYVPKYSVNSKLQANIYSNYSDVIEEQDDLAADRRYDFNDADVPYYRDEPVYQRKDNVMRTTRQAGENLKKRKTTKVKKKKTTTTKTSGDEKNGRKSDGCCTKKVLLALLIILLVAAILLAIALGLYFGYYEQLGSPVPMTAYFRMGVPFSNSLYNTSNPYTLNVTKAICNGFMQVVGTVPVVLSTCQLVSYTPGSINSTFNITIRYKRDLFMNSGNGQNIVTLVKSALTADFFNQMGQFYNSLSSVFNGTGYNLTLYDLILTSQVTTTTSSTTPANSTKSPTSTFTSARSMPTQSTPSGPTTASTLTSGSGGTSNSTAAIAAGATGNTATTTSTAITATNNVASSTINVSANVSASSATSTSSNAPTSTIALSASINAPTSTIILSTKTNAATTTASFTSTIAPSTSANAATTTASSTSWPTIAPSTRPSTNAATTTASSTSTIAPSTSTNVTTNK